MLAALNNTSSAALSIVARVSSPRRCGSADAQIKQMKTEEVRLGAGRAARFSASEQSAGCFRPTAADAMRDLSLSKRSEWAIAGSEPPGIGGSLGN
jgi:hypothetical protein